MRALNQRLLAPCQHTLMLLERQDVVQPHDEPIVSGGTRAADTSDDDPLSANTLRALPPNDHVGGGRALQRLLRRLLVEHTSRASLPTTSVTSPG